jgi:hypothetical protein
MRSTVWVALICAAALLPGWLVSACRSKRRTRGDRSPLSPLSPETGSIFGRIRSNDGGPIAGAIVVARYSKDRSEEIVETGGDGGYRFDALSPGRYRVWASAREHLAPEETDVGPRELDVSAGTAVDRVDIMLARGGEELRGTIVDRTGGSVPGATVYANVENGYERMPAVDRADGTGAFSIWVLRGRRAELTAKADGFAEGRGFGAGPLSGLVIALTRESVIEGRAVVGHAGVPAVGIEVIARGAITGRSYSNGGSAKTDSNGSFRIRGLEPDRYEISTRGARLLTPIPRVYLGYREHSEVQLEVDLSFSVAGRAQSADEGELSGPRWITLRAPGIVPSETAMIERDGVTVQGWR